MKLSKYITTAVLTLVALLFIGELYVWHMQGFETEYSLTTFYLPKNMAQGEMIEDLERAAEKENIEFFAIQRKMRSSLTECVDIYGSSGAKPYLEKNSNVAEGTFRSVFLGESHVRFRPFRSIPDLSDVTEYYLIGDEASKIRFKQALVDKYAGAFPREGYSMMNGKGSVALLWAVAFSLALLLTLYEVSLLKKETVIRLVSGEDLRSFTRRKIAGDLLFYIVMFLSEVCASRQFSNTTWNFAVTLLCFLGFLFLNSMGYLFLLAIRPQRDMRTKSSTKKTLKLSYFYKTVSTCAMLMVLAGTISLVHEGIQCYRQKDFFKEHKGYSYVAIGLEDAFDDDRLEKIIDKLYNRCSAKGKEIALVEVEALNSTDTYLYADQGAREYLENAIPELRSMRPKHKRYIIRPQEQKWDKTAQSEAREVFEAYSSTLDGKAKRISEREIDTFEYSGQLELIAIDGNSEPIRSSWHRNPIILFDNRSLGGAANVDYAIWQAAMLNVTDREWNDFIKEENLERETAYRTNVYENYLHQWQTMKKGMLIGIVLSSILFLLEGIILRTILRYEYDVCAQDLALKRIFGYKIWERHGKLLKITVLTGFVSIGAAIAANWMLEMDSARYVFVGGVLMILLELLILGRYAIKMERRNIQKILKGGMF